MPTSESAIGRSGDGRSPITQSAITRSTITRSHESPLGRWEMTLGAPAAALRPYVREYDQAHLTRDVRAFAGVTPGELVKSLMPDQGGFSADR